MLEVVQAVEVLEARPLCRQPTHHWVPLIACLSVLAFGFFL
ncbi:hypothetical protein [Cupriavidus sp. AcVe19-6a]|nr:hypothetical protein [Cupriavidus sp. AcVe19-6a]